jgi:outer membrane protein assembly factor BamB
LEWSAPVAAYGMVAAAAATHDGEAYIYCFDSHTGASMWEPYRLGAPVYPDQGGVAFDAGRLFAADLLGTVTCLDAVRGTRVWQTELPDGARVYGAVTPTGSGLLLVAIALSGGGGRAMALDVASGRIVYSVDLSGAASVAMAYADGSAFAHTDDGQLVALEASSGEALWATNCNAKNGAASGKQLTSAPVVSDARVFTATSRGQLSCHDAVTGHRDWTLDVTNQELTGTPAFDGRLLYVPAADGLYLLHPDRTDARVVRHYPARRAVRSAIVLADTEVLYISADGAVRGLEARPGTPFSGFQS